MPELKHELNGEEQGFARKLDADGMILGGTAMGQSGKDEERKIRLDEH